MNPFIRGVVVFACAIVVDIAWGYYIRRAAQGKAFLAANWAVLILIAGVFNTFSWLENHWMVFPLWAGSWVGTYSVITWDRKKNTVPVDPVE